MGSENSHGRAQNAENGFGFNFLQLYHKDWDDFLIHILRITGDESWVSSVNAESKEQSKQWMRTHSPNRQNIFNKRCLSARKLMATVFWERNGVLIVEFMQEGTTISSEVCCVGNTKKLRRAIQNKRRGMLTSSVVSFMTMLARMRVYVLALEH
jgi:hypothetical protein